jgi:hypothetical protein
MPDYLTTSHTRLPHRFADVIRCFRRAARCFQFHHFRGFLCRHAPPESVAMLPIRDMLMPPRRVFRRSPILPDVADAAVRFA